VGGIPVMFAIVVVTAATDDTNVWGGDIDDDYLTYDTDVY